MVVKTTHSRTRLIRWAGAAGLVVAGLVGGGVLGSTLSASADPSATPSAPSPSATQNPGGGQGGAKPVRGDEKAVSSADETKLRAAALEAVPDGTVVRIETDSGGAAYEAHMTKADGSQVTVKFDESLAVIEVQDGMGK